MVSCSDNKSRSLNAWFIYHSVPVHVPITVCVLYNTAVFCCGPAPVAAVKTGNCKIKYDLPFVFAEVNSDVIRWEYVNKTTWINMGTDTNRLGPCPVHTVCPVKILKWDHSDEKQAYCKDELSIRTLFFDKGNFKLTWAENSSELFWSTFVRCLYCRRCRKLFTFSSCQEALGQFQPYLAQNILGWRGFKFVQIKNNSILIKKVMGVFYS